MSEEKSKSKWGLFAAASLKILAKVVTIIGKMTKVGLAVVSFATYAYMFTWQFSLIIMDGFCFIKDSVFGKS